MNKARRILIVEDETLTAMAIESYFEALGVTVTGVYATGEDAILAARSDKPDIIFMDIRLAGRMDGIEAARLINAERHTPIVFISGYSSRSFEVSECKPIAYLSKPIDFDDLELALASLDKA